MKVSRPRVFFVNRYFFPDESATSQLLGDLLFALAARDFEVHVICSRQLYGKSSAALAAEELIQGVHVHRVWTTRFGRQKLFGRMLDYASFYVSCAFFLLHRLRSADQLIAMTDPPLISIVAAIAGRIRGAVRINWLQDVFPEVATHLLNDPLPSWLDQVICRFRDYSLRSASMNVLIGSRMYEFFATRRIPPEKTCVIENWADPGAIAPKGVNASTLRDRLSLQGKFVVSYSGNLGRAHEFETLLGAAEVLRTDPTFVFLIIGDGVRMAQLRNAVTQKGLSSFRFLPYQPRESLQDSLSAGDVHIVSLLPVLEGLIVPSKVYGILSAARPVIFVGDADGETARLVQRAKCGVVIGVNEVHDLALALRDLRDAPDTCLRLGQRARQVLLSDYSKNHGIERWLAVLDKCRAEPDK